MWSKTSLERQVNQTRTNQPFRDLTQVASDLSYDMCHGQYGEAAFTAEKQGSDFS